MRIALLLIFSVVGIQGFHADPMFKNEVCLSEEEIILYKTIMKYRKHRGLKPIPYSSKLTHVAQMHARDLSEYYDYTNRGRCNPHSWSDNGSWTPCCYTDNHKQAHCMWDKPKEIAGYSGNGYEIAYYSSSGARALEGFEGWRKSQSHNSLLINSKSWKKVTWQGIGIGIYGQYGVVWFGEVLDNESCITPCK